MGLYEAEWYGFEVESMRHLMDLYIEPSFHSAICIQFHEMADRSYRAFYNYQPDWKKVVDVLKTYARERNMDSSTKVMDVIDVAVTAGVFKPLAPVSSYVLREDEKRCVEELYRNELPATDEHIIGLDGHSYTLRIFKDGEEKCYRTWCATPLSWSTLRNLVSTVVDRLGLDPGGYGAYVKKNT